MSSLEQMYLMSSLLEQMSVLEKTAALPLAARAPLRAPPAGRFLATMVALAAAFAGYAC